MKLKYVVSIVFLFVVANIYSQNVFDYYIKDSSFGKIENSVTIQDIIELDFQDNYQMDYTLEKETCFITIYDSSTDSSMTYFFRLEKPYAILYMVEITENTKVITRNSNLTPNDILMSIMILGMMVK